MIRCPKCSFEQPPDRYCARCGVNMETFKAPPTPLSRKLAGSGGFNIFLVVTVVVATAYFIYNRRTADNVIPIPVPPAAPAVAARAVPPTTLPPAPPPAEEKLKDTVGETLKVATTALFKKEVTTTTGQIRVVESASATAKLPAKMQIIVHFIEVPQAAVPALFGGSEGATSGVIPDFETRLNEAKRTPGVQALTRLEKSITTDVPVDFEQIWSDGKGLIFHVTPSTAKEDAISLKVDVENKFASSTAPNASLQSQDVESGFVVGNGGAAYFAGIVTKPPNVKPEEEDLLARHPVFKALSSSAYQQNLSEIFVFFEVRGLSAESH